MSSKSMTLILCFLLFATVSCSTESAVTQTATSIPPTVMDVSPSSTPIPPTVTAIPLSPTPEPTTNTYEIPPDAFTWLDQMAEDKQFNGSVLVANKGAVLLSEGYGLADREQEILNTPQTRYRIASLTKQFTAMAILILESQGDLAVTDSICDYIANFPAEWEAITIHHLLTHTSGIPEPLSRIEYLQARATPIPLTENIDRLRDVPLDFEPGEDWSYGNNGYIILGYIIEAVSDQSYEEFLNQAIFIPLELNDTGYDHSENGWAIGYKGKYSTLEADYIDMSRVYAAGALYSTVEDLYRWEQALQTEQLVPQASLDKMFAPQADTGEGWSYGYGWGIAQSDGRKIIFHQGATEGFRAIIALYPEEQVTIIVLSNHEDQNVQVIMEILSIKVFGD